MIAESFDRRGGAAQAEEEGLEETEKDPGVAFLDYLKNKKKRKQQFNLFKKKRNKKKNLSQRKGSGGKKSCRQTSVTLHRWKKAGGLATRPRAPHPRFRRFQRQHHQRRLQRLSPRSTARRNAASSRMIRRKLPAPLAHRQSAFSDRNGGKMLARNLMGGRAAMAQRGGMKARRRIGGSARRRVMLRGGRKRRRRRRRKRLMAVGGRRRRHRRRRRRNVPLLGGAGSRHHRRRKVRTIMPRSFSAAPFPRSKLSLYKDRLM